MTWGCEKSPGTSVMAMLPPSTTKDKTPEHGKKEYP